MLHCTNNICTIMSFFCYSWHVLSAIMSLNSDSWENCTFFQFSLGMTLCSFENASGVRRFSFYLWKFFNTYFFIKFYISILIQKTGLFKHFFSFRKSRNILRKLFCVLSNVFCLIIYSTRIVVFRGLSNLRAF